ncbi:MAG: protease inhibitor I9 family protein, partial [Deltaproteobacteria bacterium]|nr:protease inhibitor I9 family protein [Deltaproteobacteria bacterium]
MKRLLVFLSVIGLSVWTGSAMAAELLPGGQGRVLGQYIVVLKSGTPAETAQTHKIVPTHVYRHALRGFAASLPEAALKRLLADPKVAYVEPDSRVWVIAPGDKPDKGKPP